MFFFGGVFISSPYAGSGAIPISEWPRASHSSSHVGGISGHTLKSPVVFVCACCWLSLVWLGAGASGGCAPGVGASRWLVGLGFLFRFPLRCLSPPVLPLVPFRFGGVRPQNRQSFFDRYPLFSMFWDFGSLHQKHRVFFFIFAGEIAEEALPSVFSRNSLCCRGNLCSFLMTLFTGRERYHSSSRGGGVSVVILKQFRFQPS